MLHMKLKTIELVLLFIFTLSLTFAERHIFFGQSLQFNGNYFDLLYISVYISDLLMIGLIFTSIYRARQNKINLLTTVSHEAKAWCLLALIVFGSILFSAPSLSYQVYWLLKLIEIGAVGLYFCYASRDKEMLATWWTAIAAGSVIQAVIAISQFIKQSSIGLTAFGEPVISSTLNGIAKVEYLGTKIIRPYGTFEHPNQLAAFGVVACVTCYFLFTRGTTLFANRLISRISHYLALLGLIASIFTIIISLSRGGILALGIIILLYIIDYLLSPRETMIVSQRNHRDTANFVVLAALLGAVIAMFPFLAERNMTASQGVSSRISYNQVGVELIEKHPIFGVGLGNLLPKLALEGEWSEFWQVQPPHNYLIHFTAELGLISIVLFLAIFLVYLYKLFKMRLDFTVKATFLTLIGVLALMQVDHYFYTQNQTILILFILLGTAHGLSRHIKKTSE